MKKTCRLETERLILQPIKIEDADLIFPLYNSPNFITHIGDRGINSIWEAENYIRSRFFPQVERLGYGNYLIKLKDSEEKIGAVGIFERAGLEVHDIGFSFLPEFEGKGYGFEAAHKLMEFAFSKLNLSKLSAITTRGNLRSQNLIKKLGFKYVSLKKLPEENEEFLYFEIEKY